MCGCVVIAGWGCACTSVRVGLYTTVRQPFSAASCLCQSLVTRKRLADSDNIASMKGNKAGVMKKVKAA